MKLKNGAQYMESLRKINPKIYYRGKLIKDVTRHPATAPHGNGNGGMGMGSDQAKCMIEQDKSDNSWSF